jgi:DNA-3-methyladenine glycosylase
LVERSFLARDSVTVAPELLNKVLTVGPCSGRIVEVEAYREDDPASHTYRGRTARNAVMFGPAGHLYVYFTYGMHFCANVVTGADGEGSAVLLRALAPLSGVEIMHRRRGRPRRLIDVANGPAKLCQALGIDRSFDGCEVIDPSSPATLSDDGTPPPRPGVSRRVGITVAVDVPWRFFVPGDPHVSRGPASAPGQFWRQISEP